MLVLTLFLEVVEGMNSCWLLRGDYEKKKNGEDTK